MAMTEEEVFDKVRETLVDALGVDDEEVESGATLTGDLGAESIDWKRRSTSRSPPGTCSPTTFSTTPSTWRAGRSRRRGWRS